MPGLCSGMMPSVVCKFFSR